MLASAADLRDRGADIVAVLCVIDRSEGAHRLADALEPFLAGPLPVRLRCWDGSDFVPIVNELGLPEGDISTLESDEQ